MKKIILLIPLSLFLTVFTSEAFSQQQQPRLYSLDELKRSNDRIMSRFELNTQKLNKAAEEEIKNNKEQVQKNKLEEDKKAKEKKEQGTGEKTTKEKEK